MFFFCVHMFFLCTQFVLCTQFIFVYIVFFVYIVVYTKKQQCRLFDNNPRPNILVKNKHSLRVGWRNFFSSCAVMSVFGSGGKQFLVYILMYLKCHTVVVLCQFFWFWWEIVFGTYVLTIQLWCCVSFFGSGGKQFLVLRTYLVYNTVVQLCS